MGIPGFTNFLDTHYKWKPTNFNDWDHVIIDGNNVFCELYSKDCQVLSIARRCPWALGGEYDRFRMKVKDFFETLNSKNPIVVMDGYEPKKKGLIIRKKRQYLKRLQGIQSSTNWNSNHCGYGLSLHAKSTFIAVLREMKIPVYVADNESDREITALANRYKCPVLSSDSDFFIFNLKYGFVHFKRHYCTRENSYYSIHDFQEQFGLKDYELCLLIPTLCGNDFISATDKEVNDYLVQIKYLSAFETCEEFLKTGENKMYCSNLEIARKLYSEAMLPDYGTLIPHEDLLVPCENFAHLPKWVYCYYKEGRLPIHEALSRTYLLSRVVQDIERDSAWMTSRHIRQHLYSIIGVPKVDEYLREKSDTEPMKKSVPALSLKHPVSVKDDSYLTINHSRLMLEVLQCHQKMPKNDFSTLPEEWKLPIAATLYWYQNLEDPMSHRGLVMALLLSFLTCHGDIPRDPAIRSLSVTSVTKSYHLKALHTFAQWKCVYHDAMTLNYLAREPFATTSPAFLYSGEVAMYHAMKFATYGAMWLDTVIQKRSSKEWKLLNKFLYLVTGYDEEQRISTDQHRDVTSYNALIVAQVYPMYALMSCSSWN